MKTLKISDIEIHDSLRVTDSQKHIEFLASLIKTQGLINPITVFKKPYASLIRILTLGIFPRYKYKVLSGTLRLKAFQLLGNKTIKAYIVKGKKWGTDLACYTTKC